MSVKKEEVIFYFFRLFRLFNFFQLFLVEKNWKKVDEAAATEVETKDEKTWFRNELRYLVTRRSLSSTTMCVKKKCFTTFSTFFNFF